MGRRLQFARRGWLVVACLVLASGCTARTSEPKYLYGVPDVRSVDVAMVEGTSGRASVVVRGVVRDACTRIESVKQTRDGHEFVLILTTRRLLADPCSDEDTPFETTVPLIVRGLGSGEYVVTAGDVSATFYYRREGVAPSM